MLSRMDGKDAFNTTGKTNESFFGLCPGENIISLDNSSEEQSSTETLPQISSSIEIKQCVKTQLKQGYTTNNTQYEKSNKTRLYKDSKENSNLKEGTEFIESLPDSAERKCDETQITQGCPTSTKNFTEPVKIIQKSNKTRLHKNSKASKNH